MTEFIRFIQDINECGFNSSSAVVPMPTSASMSMPLSVGEYTRLPSSFVGSFHFPSINSLPREQINEETLPSNCSFQQNSNFEFNKNCIVVPCTLHTGYVLFKIGFVDLIDDIGKN